MLRSVGKLAISSDLSSIVNTSLSGNQSPGTPEPDTPGGSKPRKKLSFKEPELSRFFKNKKSSSKTKNFPTNSSKDPISHISLDEETFEEDENYEELEVNNK